jgi:hypothetical protein
MNGRVLIDTNVLVYIYDPFDTAKQERAIALPKTPPCDRKVTPQEYRVNLL